jgi:hypothetical protein
MSNTEHIQPSPDFYKAGGTLDVDAASYVVRAADAELPRFVKQGQFCYVLTPRQMGKSSLMVRTAQSLRDMGIASVIIDLTARDVTNTTANTWYLGQLLEISDQLGLSGNFVSWWKRQIHLGIVQRFSKFLTDVVLKRVTQPVVIFVDEIDSTLSLPFNCDDYFAMIRALYNRHAFDPALKSLTFVLLGVVSPSDLIRDAKRTPFNIGTRIQLSDFTAEEARPLLHGLAPDQDIAEDILKQILFLTGGHPYLTQKTCMRVASWAQSKWNPTQAFIIVDEVVEEMFLSESGQNQDDNLQLIRKRILASKSVKQLLQVYRRIRSREVISDSEIDPIVVELKLSGLVKADESGILMVRNSIYERVFDEAWITAALNERERHTTKGLEEFLYDVYISYSRQDARWVEGYLLPSLETAELRVWSDREIRPGQVWASEIEKTIAQSRNMLVVLSPAGIASSLVQGEYRSFFSSTARESNRLLIPLLLTPTLIPPYLARYHFINFTDRSRWHEAMQELLLALGVPKFQDFHGGYTYEAFKLPPSKAKRYNTATIRKLLDAAFEDKDLSAFIYDYYLPLYLSREEIQKTESTDLPSEARNLTSKSGKIQLLIEYAGKVKTYDKLLDDIARERPRHYAKYADQLEMSDDALS